MTENTTAANAKTGKPFGTERTKSDRPMTEGTEAVRELAQQGAAVRRVGRETHHYPFDHLRAAATLPHQCDVGHPQHGRVRVGEKCRGAGALDQVADGLEEPAGVLKERDQHANGHDAVERPAAADASTAVRMVSTLPLAAAACRPSAARAS